MTKIEAIREAIRTQSIVYYVNQSELWGIPVSISDDETVVYYRPRGLHGTLASAYIDRLEILHD